MRGKREQLKELAFTFLLFFYSSTARYSQTPDYKLTLHFMSTAMAAVTTTI